MVYEAAIMRCPACGASRNPPLHGDAFSGKIHAKPEGKFAPLFRIAAGLLAVPCAILLLLLGTGIGMFLAMVFWMWTGY